MNKFGKRLTALNLVLLLLITLLPGTALAVPEQGDEAATAEDEVALAGSYQYIRITNQDGSASNYYCIGDVTLGNTTVGMEGGEGTGWSYSDGVLTLTEDYSGAPISAVYSLLIRAEGDVTVRGSGGPAISAGQSLRFLTSQDASLTLVGDGAAAVKTGSGVEVESPLDLTLETVDLPASPKGISYEDPKYASHNLLINRTFTGDDAASAAEVETINFYEAAASGTTLKAYLPYIRFEGMQMEDLQITLTLDPDQGTLPGAAADETVVITVPAEDVTFPDFETLEIDLASVPVPTRTGYLPAGWIKEEDDTRCYTDSLTTETANTPLTTLWVAKPAEEYILFNGSGETLISDELKPQAVDALALQNGTITLPDLENDGFVGWNTAEMDFPRLYDGEFYEGLYYPGQTVSLPSGTTLYAVYTEQDVAVLHGNGHTTANGNDRIVVPAGILMVTDSSLYVYSKAITAQEESFFQSSGQALLDFNTKADGSGSSSGVVEEDSYAQWADAAAGSILLYSYTPATASGRFGKVLTPQQAAAFDPTNAYGFTRDGYDFAGWYSGNTKITDTLPAANEQGYICLSSRWVTYSVTYGEGGTKSHASSDGSLTFRTGTAPEGKVFNGWNSAADGSGIWYYPDQTITLTESITVYPQYLDTPTEGSWVLVESETGPGLYQLLMGTATADGKVTVTLPESEIGWYYWANGPLPYTSDSFGYCGGKTYTLENHLILSQTDRKDGMFHGNGGTFEAGSEIRSVVISGTSSSHLYLYPTANDFETTPAGKTLGGWTEDETLAPDSKIYAPGYENTPDTDYYAVWDDADTAYVKFIDKDTNRDESFTLRSTAGGSITLPTPLRTGYVLTGWNDGATTYPGGSSFTVPAGGATLTAAWTQQTNLIVDGKEYDASVTHDYSNGSSKGWKYEPNGTSAYLYLYDYEGGPIFLPRNADILLNGTNTITGTSTAPAVSGTNSIYFRKDWNNYYTGTSPRALTLTGGSGMPAVSAYSVNLQDNVDYILTGGSGAPAAAVEYQVNLSSGHVQMVGGSGAPALKTAYSYGSGLYCNNMYAHLFTGTDAEHLAETEDDDYDGEACIVTTPVYRTLTLDAGEGKVNGRSSLVYQLEYGERVMLNELDTYHSQGKFVTWVDENGSEVSYSVYLYNSDKTLTAKWNVSPYERYIYLDCRGVGTVNGQDAAYIELPESGTIRLPELVLKDSYADKYKFLWWYAQDENGNTAAQYPTSLDIPVEWLEHGMELRANWNSSSGSSAYVFLHPNGTTFTGNNGESLMSRWVESSGFEVETWWGRENAHGYVIDSWNTKPDGSGTTYQVGQTVTLTAGDIHVWYAQWKPALTYVTKKANEIAPYSNSTYRNYGCTEDGEYLASLIGWRTEDGSKFYFSGDSTTLPAGTTLYAVYGDLYDEATILLYGNGADSPDGVQFSSTWRYNDAPCPLYATADNAPFRREGYRLAGWNTRADGTGTAYPADVRFQIGTIDSNENWNFDDTLMAALPDALYAQWELLPAAEIPVPADMLEEEDAVILAAFYDENGQYLGLQSVAPSERYITPVEEDFDSYEFFCLSDDNALAPLLASEQG